MKCNLFFFNNLISTLCKNGTRKNEEKIIYIAQELTVFRFFLSLLSWLLKTYLQKAILLEKGGVMGMSETLFPLVTRFFVIEPVNKEKIWEDEWKISMRDEKSRDVGVIRFGDGSFHDELNICVDMDKEYDKEKYTADIFFSIAKFVFGFQNVREVSTSCRHEDDHRLKGLEKAGFVRRETVDGYDHYSMKKQKSAWTGFYVIIGIIAGFMIGILISNLWAGTIAGVLIGSLIGYLLDKKES